MRLWTSARLIQKVEIEDCKITPPFQSKTWGWAVLGVSFFSFSFFPMSYVCVQPFGICSRSVSICILHKWVFRLCHWPQVISSWQLWLDIVPLDQSWRPSRNSWMYAISFGLLWQGKRKVLKWSSQQLLGQASTVSLPSSSSASGFSAREEETLHSEQVTSYYVSTSSSTPSAPLLRYSPAIPSKITGNHGSKEVVAWMSKHSM